MIYDGDCAFCAYWIERWRARAGERMEYVTYQETAEQFPQISRERFERAVHLIEPDGRISAGAEAVFRALEYAPGPPRRSLWLYQHIPGLAPLCEWVYRFIADHRRQFSALMRLLPAWRRKHRVTACGRSAQRAATENAPPDRSTPSRSHAPGSARPSPPSRSSV
jgi:predicted DCC family thiol-disulfide oxidoreductase YuxK